MQKIINLIEANHHLHEMLKNCPYRILEKMSIYNFQEGEVLIYQGDIIKRFYMIVEGSANIYVMSENGRRYSQAIYKKGDFIGEIEIFDGLPSVSNVEALSNLVLIKDPKELAYNREYRSVIGYYKDIPVLVVSTGIGGPSAGIAVEELANIGVTTLIRIGSSGALQDYLQLGDLIISAAAVRNEGTTKAYIENGYPAVANHQLVSTLENVSRAQNFRFHTGLVRSHDSFYTEEEERIDQYWSSKEILGADMETSTLFVLGSLRGLQTASILNVVVPSKGNLENGINDLVEGKSLPIEGEKKQIIAALEGIASIHNNKPSYS